MRHVLLVDSGTAWRGGQRQTALLAAGLPARGVAVTIASPLVHAPGATTIPWFSGSDLSLRAAWCLARLTPVPDVVHAMDARAHAAAGLARVFGLAAPLVVTRHLERPPRGRIKYRGVARFIAVSPAVRDALSAVAPGSGVSVIPPAIAVPADETPADLSPLGIPHGAALIVSVAALTREKGLDRVIALAAACGRAGVTARWLIVGDGPERARLARLAAASAAPIVFAGWRDDVGSILRAARLMVHLPRAESFGLAALEATARGVPVVAAHVGGLVDLVTPDVGTLVHADDHATAVPAVRRWLSDAVALEGARRARPAIAARYTPDRMTDATVAVYRDVLRTAADRPVRLSADPSVRLSS